MFYQKDILESQVIRDYLNGKTRNQIAIDNNTSPGNVSNITNEWKRRIGKSDGEEIRDFVKSVRKAGLSVKQCADGYRTTQLMKKLGIFNDDEIHQDNNEEFTAFVNEIDGEYDEDAKSDIPQHQQLRLGFEDSPGFLHPNEPTLAKNPNDVSGT